MSDMYKLKQYHPCNVRRRSDISAWFSRGLCERLCPNDWLSHLPDMPGFLIICELMANKEINGYPTQTEVTLKIMLITNCSFRQLHFTFIYHNGYNKWQYVEETVHQLYNK